MSHAEQGHSASARVERSIVAAHNGSFSALGQLLDHYRDYLLQVANSELQSDLVAKVAPSDLVQETFFQAARGFPAFQGRTEGELRAWLRQILINRLRDTKRRYFSQQKRAISRELPLEPADKNGDITNEICCPRPAPADQVVASETSALVLAALEKLPDTYRRVIELRHFEHRSLAEIGIVFDRSPEAVRKLWCRAVEKLNRELSKYRSTRQ